jgi:hypothetical protein
VIRDRWFARGANCPVVISLGNDPSFTLAGAENVGFGQNELEFGGFLRGARYAMITGPRTGLPFPATAEVVLEGEILHPDREPKRSEGPWGEGLGYYASAFDISCAATAAAERTWSSQARQAAAPSPPTAASTIARSSRRVCAGRPSARRVSPRSRLVRACTPRRAVRATSLCAPSSRAS